MCIRKARIRKVYIRKWCIKKQKSLNLFRPFLFSIQQLNPCGLVHAVQSKAVFLVVFILIGLSIYSFVYQWLVSFIVLIGIGLFWLLWLNGGTYGGHGIEPKSHHKRAQNL
jgi:hypothetical protein